MPMLLNAELGPGPLILPLQFSYRPHITRKRTSVTATANGVVTQAASPVRVNGDSTLSWTVRGAFPSEFQSLYDLFNEADLTLLTFKGYWAEVLQVYFVQLDPPTVRGRIWDLSGMFQVAEVTTDYAAACGLIP